MMQQRKLSFQLADYEWIMFAEALDQYAYKNEDCMDVSKIYSAQEYILDQIGIFDA